MTATVIFTANSRSKIAVGSGTRITRTLVMIPTGRIRSFQPERRFIVCRSRLVIAWELIHSTAGNAAKKRAGRYPNERQVSRSVWPVVRWPIFCTMAFQGHRERIDGLGRPSYECYGDECLSMAARQSTSNSPSGIPTSASKRSTTERSGDETNLARESWVRSCFSIIR